MENLRAEVAWNIWRRILSEDDFARAALGQNPELLQAHNLTDEEVRICRHYSLQPKRTKWFIENYRYRLVSSTCYCIELAAPLTSKLLVAKGISLSAMADYFLREKGYGDRGPFVYERAEKLLEFIRGTYSNDILHLLDVINLETASIKLTRATPEHGWKIDVRYEERDSSVIRLRDCVSVVMTNADLRPWLRSQAQIGQTSLALDPQIFIVLAPMNKNPAKYYAIDRAHQSLLYLLKDGMSYRDLSELIHEPEAGDSDDVESLIDRLKYLHALELVNP